MTKILALITGFLGLVVVLAIVLALPTYFLWNYLMPDLFGLGEITFWQAFWLNVFTSILFKSSSSGSSDE